MTHAELVVLAARWLRGTRRCAVVATERQDWRSMENPDAIGWLRDGVSILVECKTSQADFAADLRKPHRIVGGMGRERWYLAQDGVLKPTSWPEGWGFLVVRSGRVFRAAQSVVRPEIAVRSELAFLTRLTRNALSGFGQGVTLGDVDMEGSVTTPLSTLPGCPKMDGATLDGGHCFVIEKQGWRYPYLDVGARPYRVCPCGISEPYWRKFGSGR